jgi:hypothetical protein
LLSIRQRDEPPIVPNSAIGRLLFHIIPLNLIVPDSRSDKAADKGSIRSHRVSPHLGVSLAMNHCGLHELLVRSSVWVGWVFVESRLDSGRAIQRMGDSVFHNCFGERVVGRCLDVGIYYSVVPHERRNFIISWTSIRFIGKHKISGGHILIGPLGIRVPLPDSRVASHLTAPAGLAQSLHLNAFIPSEPARSSDPRLLALLYELVLPQIQLVLTAVIGIHVAALLYFLQTSRVAVTSTHQTQTVLC